MDPQVALARVVVDEAHEAVAAGRVGDYRANDLFAAVPGAHAQTRIKDIVDVENVRENQLVGYGIVTGLAGTGDDTSAPFASQSVLALLRRLGVQVDSSQVRLKNVAAVIVTATLPPFSRPGTKIDGASSATP